MGKVILIYLIIQLVTTAFGLSVIETIRPIVNKKLIDDGYVLMNKNSMYKFNENLVNFLKGLIPCYYLFKALNMVKGQDAVEREAINQIRKGNYVTMEEYLNPTVEVNAEDQNVSRIVKQPEPFTKEKYTARKNNLYSLEDTDVKAVKYKETRSNSDDSFEITPFSSKYIKPPKFELSMQDVFNAVREFSPEVLYKLSEKFNELAEVKRGHPVLKLKECCTDK